MLVKLLKMLVGRVTRLAILRKYVPLRHNRAVPAEVAAVQTVGGAPLLPGGLVSGRWLEDTHRLRPQKTPTPEPVQHDAGSSSTQEPGVRAGQPITNRSRTTHGNSAPLVPVQVTEPLQPVSHQQQAALASSQHQQQLSAEDQILRRSLMSLRHLVRLGIYNEGFTSGKIPQQYLHSLGLEEEPTDDTLQDL